MLTVLARRAAARRSAAHGYFRSPSRRRSTATGADAATITAGKAKAAKPWWADYVPVYGALGATAFSVTLGLGAAGHELAHAPNVRLDKKKREALPEVAAPDLAVDEADRFRRREKKAVTLKDAGVEPPGIERTREEVLGSFCRRNNT
ncbi:unnamed protein product [Urochloa decumbens]|uniref:Uncharacterized protein n=1 Tax=Urochloa decumbens TaxID=240449 RepID=A0ABC9AUX2_9POAL